LLFAGKQPIAPADDDTERAGRHAKPWREQVEALEAEVRRLKRELAEAHTELEALRGVTQPVTPRNAPVTAPVTAAERMRRIRAKRRAQWRRIGMTFSARARALRGGWGALMGRWMNFGSTTPFHSRRNFRKIIGSPAVQNFENLEPMRVRHTYGAFGDAVMFVVMFSQGVVLSFGRSRRVVSRLIQQAAML
jgi:hypothetical protein